MITISLITIAWILYAMLEGAIESALFYKSKLANNFNNFHWIADIHSWYTVRRGMFATCLIVILVLFVGEINLKSVILGMLQLLNFLFSFFFFHDGAMYYVRQKIDPDNDFNGFFTDDLSFDSSSQINVSSSSLRLLLLSIGIVIAFVELTIYWLI